MTPTRLESQVADYDVFCKHGDAARPVADPFELQRLIDADDARSIQVVERFYRQSLRHIRNVRRLGARRASWRACFARELFWSWVGAAVLTERHIQVVNPPPAFRTLLARYRECIPADRLSIA